MVVALSDIAVGVVAVAAASDARLVDGQVLAVRRRHLLDVRVLRLVLAFVSQLRLVPHRMVLRLIERIIIGQEGRLDILLQLHLLVRPRAHAAVRGVLARVALLLLVIALFLLQFDHLLLGALQLLEQRGEGLHDLLADRQQVVLGHVAGVGAEGARLADGQVLFVLFDSLDDLG